MHDLLISEWNLCRAKPGMVQLKSVAIVIISGFIGRDLTVRLGELFSALVPRIIFYHPQLSKFGGTEKWSAELCLTFFSDQNG